MQGRKAYRPLLTEDVINHNDKQKDKMSVFDSKVIGYIASETKIKVICTDVDACLIAGSKNEMSRYLIELEVDDLSLLTVRKVRFGDIIKGMKLGGKYSFDKEAYDRFFPLGKKIGLQLVEADFNEEEGRKFFTVKIDG
jgi:hypothetical protein